MGKMSHIQKTNHELFSQLSYEALDAYIKGLQAELKLITSDSETLILKRYIKSAKIVRRQKRT